MDGRRICCQGSLFAYQGLNIFNGFIKKVQFKMLILNNVIALAFNCSTQWHMKICPCKIYSIWFIKLLKITLVEVKLIQSVKPKQLLSHYAYIYLPCFSFCVFTSWYNWNFSRTFYMNVFSSYISIQKSTLLIFHCRLKLWYPE